MKLGLKKPLLNLSRPNLGGAVLFVPEENNVLFATYCAEKKHPSRGIGVWQAVPNANNAFGSAQGERSPAPY
jgi:hypothetical protein